MIPLGFSKTRAALHGKPGKQGVLRVPKRAKVELSPLLPTYLSRTLGERGDRALDAALMKTFRYVIPLLGGYCLLVALCAGPVLRLFYQDA